MARATLMAAPARPRAFVVAASRVVAAGPSGIVTGIDVLARSLAERRVAPEAKGGSAATKRS